MNDQWIQDEILRGLQKLLALSLERTPASNLLPITVGTWFEAVTHNRVFDQGLDTDRFRAAFTILFDTRTTWPAPKDFIAVLPDRQQLALAKKPIKANPERAAAAAEELADWLGKPDRKTAAAGPDA